MGGIGFKSITGSLIRSLVMTHHYYFIICSKYFIYCNIESVKENRQIHENVCYYCFGSYVHAVAFYKRHTLTFVPFNCGIK